MLISEFLLGRRNNFPLDFFLWGYFKKKLFKNSPQNICDLKTNISHIIAVIEKVTLKKVNNNLRKRARLCIKQRVYLNFSS